MSAGNGWTAAIIATLLDWLKQLPMRIVAWYVFIPAGMEGSA